MRSKVFSFTLLLFTAACTPTTAPTPERSKPTNQPTVTRSLQANLSAFKRVSARVEPVAERSCRSIHKTNNTRFCDFVIRINNDPRQPANAFQSIGRDGRPVITFNINMIKSIRNDHEIAFILGHEAGHQIARHLIKQRQNHAAGAIVGGIIAAATGINIGTGTDLGGLVGARSFSRTHELQADRIGTHIAARVGYNPVIGAKSFNRTAGGSNFFLATHPPSQDRINTVNRTAAEIKAARAQGKTPPITW